LVIWFFPVLWIGIALYEEIMRVFLLKCLMNLSEKRTWTIIAIILTSVLRGFVHIYQGFAGVISIGIIV
jgi:membrane protease YdiL (CAAX protease family)